MTHGDGGKGSGRRKEDASKISDNWDLIFKPKGKTMMNDHEEEPQERSDEDIERSEYHDDSEWQCDACGGPMYQQAHWNYGQCDDCGARQELIDDY